MKQTQRDTTQDCVKNLVLPQKHLSHTEPYTSPSVTLVATFFSPAHLAATVSLSHPSVLKATTLGCAVAYSANTSPRNED